MLGSTTTEFTPSRRINIERWEVRKENIKVGDEGGGEIYTEKEIFI